MTNQIQKQQELKPEQRQFISIKQAMEQMAPQMAEVVPRHLSAEKLMKVALGSIKKDSKLLACSVSSLLSCVMEASKLGLSIGGPLGEAHLVPFGSEATLIIGYRGFVNLMRRSGAINVVRAVVVHEKDRFHYTEGFTPTIIHEPSLDDEPGELKRVYAIAKFAGTDDYQFVILNKKEVARAKAASRNQSNWDKHPEEYWKKTAVRRLAKLTPLSDEEAEAIERDDEASYVDTTAVEVAQDTASTAASVKKQLAAKRLVIQPEATEAVAGEPPPDVVLPTEGKS